MLILSNICIRKKLEENHKIAISYQTARRWMTKEGLWKPKKQRKKPIDLGDHGKKMMGRITDSLMWLSCGWIDFADENGEPSELCLC